jgi:hypothetical protein
MNSFFPRAVIGGSPNPSIPVVVGAIQQITKKFLWNVINIWMGLKGDGYLGKERIFFVPQVGGAT